ncbi:glutamate receptor U1-like [Ixodes scapularis]|uniref:glutamate receptor U1-like n=1 Tax=Ixodes scapularis TaxID=6945 RepID=UPI001C3842CF|nr:glutamate receptor U1-like [Ixodes scapularis]
MNMTGPMSNLLETLSDGMGFTYSVSSPEDSQWGIALPGGNWTGMVGMLHQNRADMALGPIAMTYDRAQVSAFSSQVTTDYLTILAGFPNVVEASVFGTLMAFEWKVWLGLLCSLLLCVFTNFVVDILMDDSKTTAKQRLIEHWWIYFSALFCEFCTQNSMTQTQLINMAF